jgi:large subunit ribosomal protein L9
MRVVLLDDIVNVGEAGSIVTVKDGYARNFLIPRRLAEVATADAVNRIELIQRAAEGKRIKRMEEAAGKFAVLSDKVLTIQMKAGTASRLFGAVTSAMIADEIYNSFGVEIDRRHIMLDEPIKHLGEFTVPLRASSDVTGEVRLVVAPEGKKREEIEAELVEKALAEERAAAEAEAAEAADASVAEVPDSEAGQAEAAAEVHEKYEDVEQQVADPDQP